MHCVINICNFNTSELSGMQDKSIHQNLHHSSVFSPHKTVLPFLDWIRSMTILSIARKLSYFDNAPGLILPSVVAGASLL